jgi:hypothetical protein
MNNMFKDRSTIDIVVLSFTFLVGLVIIMIVFGSLLARIIRPELDVTRVVESTIEIINTMVGALIGFLGGRAIGRIEANGPSSPQSK